MNKSKKESQRKAFQRARDELENMDLVKCNEDIWYVRESETDLKLLTISVNVQRDTGQERDIAGHVPLSHPVERDGRDTPL